MEDPPELNLEGRHGNGRIVQVWANAANGGYQEQLRIDCEAVPESFLGEIRDPDTAAEAARAGLNGHLIFATQHCEDIEGGIERLHSLAVQRMEEAGSVIAKSTGRLCMADARRHSTEAWAICETTAVQGAGRQGQRLREGEDPRRQFCRP